jgi:hypothetical protein
LRFLEPFKRLYKIIGLLIEGSQELQPFNNITK